MEWTAASSVRDEARHPGHAGVSAPTFHIHDNLRYLSTKYLNLSLTARKWHQWIGIARVYSQESIVKSL